MKSLKATTLMLLGIGLFVKLQAQPFTNKESFEIWDTINGYAEPRYWHTLNLLTMFGMEPTTTLTTDAHSGQYAVKLTSVSGRFNNSAGLLTSGQLLNDDFTPNFNNLKVPYNKRPTSFKFYYKAQPVLGDTCAILILLTKWNNTTQQSDTIGMAEFGVGSTVNNYTEANINFNYTSTELPDSGMFIATSSLDGFDPIPGSTLIIDDLELVYNASDIAKQTNQQKIDVYPNPATDMLYIAGLDFNNIPYELQNINGQIIKSGYLNNSNSINIMDVKEGIYLLKVRYKNVEFFAKIVK